METTRITVTTEEIKESRENKSWEHIMHPTWQANSWKGNLNQGCKGKKG